MASATGTGVTTTQVHEIYIRATPEAIWQAITSPEWTERYGYKGPIEMDLRPGGAYRALANEGMRAMGMPEVVIDGVVEEADPPRRLVHTYRFLFSDVMRDEGYTRVTWEIERVAPDFCSLTVTHDVSGAPMMASMVSSRFSETGTGGWSWILSDIKSLLETGSTM